MTCCFLAKLLARDAKLGQLIKLARFPVDHWQYATEEAKRQGEAQERSSLHPRLRLDTGTREGFEVCMSLLYLYSCKLGAGKPR